MSAAATRDDLAAVVDALTKSAAEQRKWELEYTTKALTLAGDSRAVFERFAAQARGTAHGFEVSADMIRKYVGVQPRPHHWYFSTPKQQVSTRAVKHGRSP